MNKNIETEIRTYTERPDNIIKSMKKIGFELVETIQQHDIILDMPSGNLFKSGQKIRLRIENEKVELTYKGKFSSSEISKRLELNIPLKTETVEDHLTFLEALGYPILFQMKKDRSIYRSKKHYSQITIDSFPIVGYMVEIEGEETEITKIAEIIAPEKRFRNYRLKEIFEEIMSNKKKTFEQLKDEYERQNNYKLGALEAILN